MLVCLLMTGIASANAQCPAGRYLTEIFSSVTLDSVTYSTPYSLKMDIYQPSGDALAARPLIILAHEGTFVSGTRESDVTVDSLCQRFARRGYVTASIDYRLSTLPNMTSSDSTLAIDEVIQAVSDGKAAVRYFVQDAATANTYKIDTNNIFIGGNSAGAVLYMHVGYLDSLGECPSYIATAMAANGGFEGNSGNPGYTTKSKAIINLAGALNEVSFVGPGDKPSVNAQGTDDVVVPYDCGYPLFGAAHITLCGLGSLEPAYDANDIYHVSHIFVGASHVPWDTDPAEFNTVDSMVTVFLYNLVCTGVLSVNTMSAITDLSLFPNPASEVLHMKASEPVKSISVYDELGRMVLQAPDINSENYEVNTSLLSKGVYFIKISFANEYNAPLVKRVVIE